VVHPSLCIQEAMEKEFKPRRKSMRSGVDIQADVANKDMIYKIDK
jgi:hypothetical protein